MSAVKVWVFPWYLWPNSEDPDIRTKINLIILSAFCSMLLIQATLKRAKFCCFKNNHKIGYNWENDFIFDLLARKRNLKVGSVIKFDDFQTKVLLWDTQGIFMYAGGWRVIFVRLFWFSRSMIYQNQSALQLIITSFLAAKFVTQLSWTMKRRFESQWCHHTAISTQKPWTRLAVLQEVPSSLQMQLPSHIRHWKTAMVK